MAAVSRLNSVDKRCLTAPVGHALTEDVVKAASGKFAADIVFRLSLHNQGLSRITGLNHCINLVDLDLTGCSFSRIEGLECLTSLTRLVLVSNDIQFVEGLQNLQKLQQLCLQDNTIEPLEALNVAHLSQLPRLTTLYLQNFDGSQYNPVCHLPGYKTLLLSKLTALTNCDGDRLSANSSYSQAAEAVQTLARQPPVQLENLLPVVQPLLTVVPALVDASDTDKEQAFEAGNKKLLTLLDECVMLHTVLKDQQQRYANNGQLRLDAA